MPPLLEAITPIDRFVCDIKESQFWRWAAYLRPGRGRSGGSAGGAGGPRVPPGPSGSPYRGRSDVLPTGRNLFSVDPRAVPSRAAHAQGVKLAEELLRRHLQDHGDYPRGLVVDLWGSATMRTAGEDFAMALHLAGLAPRGTRIDRVTGFEVIPLALLGRPRIDVTLRVSGLFRDVFPGLAQLFEAGAEALAAREESVEDNPYTARIARVFGPEPGRYGLGMGADLDIFTPEARAARRRGVACGIVLGHWQRWPLAARPRGAGGAGAWPPTPLSMRRTWPKPTCCWPPTTPRTRRVLPPPWRSLGRRETHALPP